MKVFLIVIAVLGVITAAVFSLSAKLTVFYDYKWHTIIKVLWIEKEIELTKLLSAIIKPKDPEVKKKVTDEMPETPASKPETEMQKEAVPVKEAESPSDIKPVLSSDQQPETQPSDKAESNSASDGEGNPKNEKPNFLKQLWDKDGIVGIMLLVSNMLQTVSGAAGVLIRGFHIHQLYVKMIIGGGDAASVAQSYGKFCKRYYPLKGIILNNMRVDKYEEQIMPDFVAPNNEFGFLFVGSISVGLLLKSAFKAVKVFLVNFIRNK